MRITVFLPFLKLSTSANEVTSTVSDSESSLLRLSEKQFVFALPGNPSETEGRKKTLKYGVIFYIIYTTNTIYMSCAYAGYTDREECNIMSWYRTKFGRRKGEKIARKDPYRYSQRGKGRRYSLRYCRELCARRRMWTVSLPYSSPEK